MSKLKKIISVVFYVSLVLISYFPAIFTSNQTKEGLMMWGIVITLMFMVGGIIGAILTIIND